MSWRGLLTIKNTCISPFSDHLLVLEGCVSGHWLAGLAKWEYRDSEVPESWCSLWLSMTRGRGRKLRLRAPWSLSQWSSAEDVLLFSTPHLPHDAGVHAAPPPPFPSLGLPLLWLCGDPWLPGVAGGPHLSLEHRRIAFCWNVWVRLFWNIWISFDFSWVETKPPLSLCLSHWQLFNWVFCPCVATSENQQDGCKQE